MCSINGILYFEKQRKVDEKLLIAARDAMVHRGPDNAANYIDGNIGLGHRRLSILDLSDNGNQPMVSMDGRFILAYNGEIYNFQDLKQDLITKGVVFKSTCDTEVLLQMFVMYGEEMLEKLNGMFAFAIWDTKERSLFLARDRVGMKPLYYSLDDSSFVFASEAKAFFRQGFPLEINEDNLNEWLLYRFVSGEATLFKGIHRLMPGSWIRINEDRSFVKKRWWKLSDKIQSHETVDAPVEWFRETFNDAVKRHMVSDVPVGILLSGGLDSGSICASLHVQKFKNMQAFNVGFRNFADNESLLAKQLAEHFQIDFHSILVEDDELAENLSIANYMLDDPLTHQNEPQLVAISRYAKRNATVLLSGEGADEFLGGYVRYKPIKWAGQKDTVHWFLKLLPDGLKSKRLQKLQRYYGVDGMDNMILLNSVNSYPSDFAKIGVDVSTIHVDYRLKMLEEAKSLYPDSYRRQAMYLDQHTYLHSLNDRNDRTTMSASIECRIPFLDHRLMEGLGTLDDKWFFTGKKGKFILKEAFKEHLPSSTLRFRKVGFSVPWVDLILKSPKMRYHWEHMEESEILQMGLLKFIDVRSLRDNLHRKRENESLLRQLFFISLWWQHYVLHFRKPAGL